VADSFVQINEHTFVNQSAEFDVTLLTTIFTGNNILFLFSYVVETASLNKSTDQPPAELHCEGRIPSYSQFTGRDTVAGSENDASFKYCFTMVIYRAAVSCSVWLHDIR
jgi:hypothetical protein